MKMKMSIVIGVIHMNLGILMSLYNNQYFRDRLSTLTEFVPQVRPNRIPCCSSCACAKRASMQQVGKVWWGGEGGSASLSS